MGENLIWGFDILWGEFITTKKPYHVILSYPYNFMSGYLNLPNNLNDMEYCI